MSEQRSDAGGVDSGRLRMRLWLVGGLVALWVLPGGFVRATDGARTTADEPHYLMTAISLGEDLDLDVSDERRDQRYRDFHEAPLLLQAEVRDDGSRVSPHDPGLPALLALPVRVGGWLGARVFLAVLTGALAAVVLWTAVRRFGVGLAAATLVVGAFFAAAPLAVYGTQVYPEVGAALAVVIGIAALTGANRAREAVLLGTALVVLAWLGVKYVPVAAALGLVGAARCGRRAVAPGSESRGAPRALVVLVVISVVGAVTYIVAHLAWYGGVTPYAAGSHFGAGELSVVGGDPDYAGRAIRLVGLLADRSFGLVAWQPLYLLALPALGAVVACRPRGWLALLAPLAAGWFVATFVALTMHGWWFPGRQVVHVLPVAVLVTAWFVGSRPWLRPLVVAGGLLGASLYAWLVVEGLSGSVNLVVTFEGLSHPLWQVTQVLLPDYRNLDAGGWLLHAGFFVVVAALVAVGAGAAKRQPAPDESGSLPESVGHGRAPVRAGIGAQKLLAGARLASSASTKPLEEK